jgi:hypothetical protein
MNFLTLSDAVASLRRHVSGGTCDRASVVRRVNEATSRLLNRPRKPLHIRRLVRFFTRKDFITLPHEIGKILHYTMDRVPAPLFSQAYEFVSHGPGELAADRCIAGKYLEDIGDFYATQFDLPSMDGIEDSNHPDEPVFSEFTLAAFSKEEADAGRLLRLGGVGALNEPLGGGAGAQLAITRWQDGVEGSILLSDPDSLSLSAPVRDVHAVRKPETAGHVSLYSYDVATHRMYFLSKYQPLETAPRYRRYRITAPDFVCGSSILAWCELGYVPAHYDDDILIVQNLDALKMMVMALEMEDERNFAMAKAHEADAYRFVDDQRTADRTHDYNLLQVSPCYGYGDLGRNW